ncbi:MAG TPA: Asp-tRNA(Asn)/Glu-tRNA(Gln) amidotransferase subunit GatC [Candidatus Limnocylindria bacterium]|nr:Asp-tRNA(Asn)/Glu-tRNA(Gln) amidotransferase subunit GatC [Candidatus Limnocylindria bacterium]
MAIISKADVLKIARISNIELHDDEIEGITTHLESVLSYARRVNELKQGGFKASNLDHKNVNVVREDVVRATDPNPILAQAPAQEEAYFVVPRILEN